MSYLPRLAVLALLIVPFAPLQASNEATTNTTVERILQDGLALEAEREWAEAVRYYESARRDHPDSDDLYRRWLISRIHLDVNRRYHDPSFEDAAHVLTTEQALALYDEILQSIETYHVETPSWSRLLRHGTAFLEVALTEEEFINEHLAGATPEQIEQFRLNVHRYVNDRPAKSRQDLRANAAFVAELARKQLSLAGAATVLEYVCGAIGLLDPYSRFMTGRQYDETMSNIEGNFVGLGVELKADVDALHIVSVIPGGPAAEGGLDGGMKILAVDDARVGEQETAHVADLLRGPENSWVTVDVADADGTVRRVTLQRRRVEVPSIEGVQLVDSERGIGYLRLTNFQKTTASDLDAALWRLDREGAKSEAGSLRSVIVDLRGNPGGLLSAAVEAADRFLHSGRIVSTRGRHTKENFDYRAHRSGTWQLPLYVLVNRDSASASEVFAGAIADHDRGVLVGERTYGKGSVQGIFRMQSAHAGICLTTAKFYSPSGRAISGAGVTPGTIVDEEHVVLRPDSNADAAMEGAIANDAVLNRALELARSASPRLTQRN